MSSGTTQVHDPVRLVTSKIAITCAVGTITQYSAVKTGQLISIAFVFTPTETIPANTNIEFTVTYSEDNLKPYQRSEIGGCSVTRNGIFQVFSSSGNFSANFPVEISSGGRWIHFIYICYD